jgi:hypothetical protein
VNDIQMLINSDINHDEQQRELEIQNWDEVFTW